MGGRGAFYGGTAIFKRHEFYAYARIDNIKIIKPIDESKSAKTPTLSHTPNSVYATLRRDGAPKQLTVYGDNREKVYEIDLDHNHSKDPSFAIHVHYYDGKGHRLRGYHHPTREQRRLIDKFIKGVNKR
ncbi:MAG: hypothetical protein Q4A45_03425 [Clostridia bacterium]|nr:hypothetical protein [Clostridia bacterium]